MFNPMEALSIMLPSEANPSLSARLGDTSHLQDAQHSALKNPLQG